MLLFLEKQFFFEFVPAKMVIAVSGIFKKLFLIQSFIINCRECEVKIRKMEIWYRKLYV